MPSSLVVLFGNEKLDVCSKTLGHYVVHFVLLQLIPKKLGQSTSGLPFIMSELHQSLYQIQGQTVNELKTLIHSLGENKDNLYIQRIRELENELRRLKKSKRYGLVWEDKPEDVVEKCKNELPILVEDSSKRIIDGGDDLPHILIEGDNYHALSVLAYTHEKKVDIIYIDPPYNTGNKSWRYNNDYVEKEDAFRHSKWIAMMEKRLRIAKDLLSDDGIICCAIDDYEVHNLRMLMDELFGEDNRLGSIVVVHNPRGRNDEKYFATMHEYLLIYGRNLDFTEIGLFNLSDEEKDSYKLSDDLGAFSLASFMRTGNNSDRITRPNLYYPIYVNPETLQISLDNVSGFVELLPINSSNEEKTWRWNKETFQKQKDTEILVRKNGDKISLYKKRRLTDETGKKPKTIWNDSKYDASSHGIVLLQKIFGAKNVFPYPKSIHQLLDFLRITSDSNSVILDFFAGSGTTGHAVLELNKEDGGKRQFILCTNNENKIAEEVTYPRICNAINGYADVEGIPANLRYYRTDFIGVDKSIDDLRGKFMGRCTDMLQVRENTFLQFPLSKNGSKAGWEGESEYFRVFQNTEKLLVVMYHPYEIETFKRWFEFLREKEAILENASVEIHKEIVVYIFSMGGEIFEEELAHLSDRIRIETIPDEVLETYKKIFGF